MTPLHFGAVPRFLPPLVAERSWFIPCLADSSLLSCLTPPGGVWATPPQTNTYVFIIRLEIFLWNFSPLFVAPEDVVIGVIFMDLCYPLTSLTHVTLSRPPSQEYLMISVLFSLSQPPGHHVTAAAPNPINRSRSSFEFHPLCLLYNVNATNTSASVTNILLWRSLH